MRTLNLSEVRERIEVSPKIRKLLQLINKEVLLKDKDDKGNSVLAVLSETQDVYVRNLRKQIVKARSDYYDSKVRASERSIKSKPLREAQSRGILEFLFKK